MKRVLVFVGLKVLELWCFVSLYLLGFLTFQVLLCLRGWEESDTVIIWVLAPTLFATLWFLFGMLCYGLTILINENWKWSWRLAEGREKAFTWTKKRK